MSSESASTSAASEDIDSDIENSSAASSTPGPSHSGSILSDIVNGADPPPAVAEPPAAVEPPAVVFDGNDAIDWILSPLSGMRALLGSSAEEMFTAVSNANTTPFDKPEPPAIPQPNAVPLPSFMSGQMLHGLSATDSLPYCGRSTDHPLLARPFGARHCRAPTQAALRCGLLGRNVNKRISISKWSAPRHYNTLSKASLVDNSCSMALSATSKRTYLSKKIFRSTKISIEQAKQNDEQTVAVYEELQEHINEGNAVEGHIVPSSSGCREAVGGLRVIGANQNTPSITLDLVLPIKNWSIMPILPLRKMFAHWDHIHLMALRRRPLSRQMRGLIDLLHTGIATAKLKITLEELNTIAQREELAERFAEGKKHRVQLAHTPSAVIDDEICFPMPLAVAGAVLLLNEHTDLSSLDLNTNNHQTDEFAAQFAPHLSSHLLKTGQQLNRVDLNSSFNSLSSLAEVFDVNPNALTHLECQLYEWSEIGQNPGAYDHILTSLSQLTAIRSLKVLSNFYVLNAPAIEAILASVTQLTSLHLFHFNAVKFHAYAARTLLLNNQGLEDTHFMMGHSAIEPPVELEQTDLNTNYLVGSAHVTQINQGLHPTAQIVLLSSLEQLGVQLNTRRFNVSCNSHHAAGYVALMPDLSKIVVLANSAFVYQNLNYPQFFVLAQRINDLCVDIGFRSAEEDGFLLEVGKNDWTQIKFFCEHQGAQIKARLCTRHRATEQFRLSAEQDDSDQSDNEDDPEAVVQGPDLFDMWWDGMGQNNDFMILDMDEPLEQEMQETGEDDQSSTDGLNEGDGDVEMDENEPQVN